MNVFAIMLVEEGKENQREKKKITEIELFFFTLP